MANVPDTPNSEIEIQADSIARTTVADNPRVPGKGAEWRRWMYRLGFRPGGSIHAYVLEGAATGTEVLLTTAGTMTLDEAPGMPVTAPLRTARVAVSWVADNEPGDWTLTLRKRTNGGTMNDVATFAITTTT